MAGIPLKKLRICPYPCRDRRKYVLGATFVLIVLLYLALAVRTISTSGMTTETAGIATAMILTAVLTGLCILLPILAIDCIFLRLAARMAAAGIIAPLRHALCERRGAPIHRLLLRDPLTCLFLAKVFEEAGNREQRPECSEAAVRMTALAVAADPELAPLAAASLQNVAERFEQRRPKTGLRLSLLFTGRYVRIAIAVAVLAVALLYAAAALVRLLGR